MYRICLISTLLLVLVLPDKATAQTDHGFQFVRIQFGDAVDSSDGEGWRRRWGAHWSHDWPVAERNLHLALDRTTDIHVEGDPIVLRLSDEEIFEYPMLYICEPGYWMMEEEEVENLRDYLNRGGFVLFDDFGSESEWIQLVEEMKRAFPDLEPRELPNNHPIWSIFYDIDPVEAPALVKGRGYFTKYDDAYIGYFDKNGRLMALACYNQDLGDGWEWPDRNFEEASTISFQMGVNFLIYALTH
ncbi:MAG: DUF4159 domain-containing protein [Bacteroidota bacterium]